MKRILRRQMRHILVYIWVLSGSVGLYAQYISEVIEYVPAPGQLVNTAWGSPRSAASLVGGVDGTLTLGSFGGYVVFSLEEPVDNHPDNPYGVDFTIFGNPMTDWSEPGIVSVMKDVNGNGLPDDTWYELAGSDYFFSSTLKDYRVTYENPGGSQAADVPWHDQRDSSGVIPANGFHPQSYYPVHDSFPGIDSLRYTLHGTRIGAVVDTSVPATIRLPQRTFGYADNRHRGTAPHTLPDNPYTPEVEHAGGDAFDIHWAVDGSGTYVDLDTIHFIRIHSGCLGRAGWLGEISTEVTGACDVVPDAGVTGPLDRIVVRDLPPVIHIPAWQLEAFVFHMGRLQPEQEITWSCSIPGATVSEDHVLSVPASGELVITASLADHPEVSTSVVTTVALATGSRFKDTRLQTAPHIYPNPASGKVIIESGGQGEYYLFNLTGKMVLSGILHETRQEIIIRGLPSGIYMLQTRNPTAGCDTQKLFIE
ncbi:MAG: T9SS type A sorting domain-containing protein [Bacteroidales bacterium]